MRVLHLFSNSRWTGPAEPALNLCVALRRIGIEADFACPPAAAGGRHTMLETARDRGIEPVLRFTLSKHAHPVKNFFDRRALDRFLAQQRYDLIHCHLGNGHRIALKPAARHNVPIVRSSYYGEGFSAGSRPARLAAKADFLLEPSRIALESDRETLGIPGDRMAVVPGAVDTERFDPRREVPDARKWLGIPATAFVVGIVARMQTHRHYGDFFEAVQRLCGKHERAHAIVVGRGTKQETVGKQPVRERGLEARVHFPGYVGGENYVGMLKAFDAKVFLVPGSDGTCRAVREALAMGKPAVVADRGMLREIVDDGENGYVVDGSPESLFEALDRLCSDRKLTRDLGQAARTKAEKVFSLEAQAAAVRGVYEKVLAGREG